LLRNRHDTWERFCEAHRDVIEETGLPAVIRSEHRFRELLECGRVEAAGVGVSLEGLPAAGWAALYRFAAAFFREFESYDPEGLFPAFRRAVERRGEQFPR
jgi:hypothetical protein